MIYIEEKLKIKDSLIHFTKNDLYYMFYDKSFNEYDYSILNSIKNNELTKDELKKDYFLDFKDILKIKEELNNKSSDEKDDMINKFMCNYNYKNIFKNTDIEEIEILKIRNNNVNENLTVRDYKEKIYKINIQDTEFRDLEKEIKDNDFIKSFQGFGFCENENGEQFIFLTHNDNDRLLMQKDSLIRMLDKYAENVIQYNNNNKDDGFDCETEITDEYKNYIRQQESCALEL